MTYNILRPFTVTDQIFCVGYKGFQMENLVVLQKNFFIKTFLKPL